MSVASLPPLPTEVLQRIFAFCIRRDQLAISKVCHQWDDAVQYLLLQQTILNVARQSDFAGCGFSFFDKIRLIDKEILQKSNRKYTSMRVDLTPSGMTPQSKRTVIELLDICQERFRVESLYMTGSTCRTLGEFFNVRREWLQNLSFLWVVIASSEPLLSAATATTGDNVVVSLPNLEKLIWNGGHTGGYESDDSDDESPRGYEYYGHSITLNAPKLAALAIAMYDSKSNRQSQQRGPQNPDVCCLFLPTLKLNSWANLKFLELEGVEDMDQSRIDNSEQMLRNLDELKFYSCDSLVTERICDKCPNLKSLIIIESKERPMDFQVSSTLSDNLEKLTIRSSRQVCGGAEFHKLRYFQMARVQFDDYDDIALEAPELTTIDVECNSICELVALLDRQLGTTGTPNKITDISMDVWSADSAELQSFLERVPLLRRLTLRFAIQLPRDLTFVECLPNLEYLFLRSFTIQLADCKKLAGLKSLILWQCTIIVPNPGDGPVPLTALEYFRVDHVSVKGNVFPIQVSDRQPSIEAVDVLTTGDTVFSSKNFIAHLL